MNDELQNQLSGLVSDARSAGKDAASFVIQQAPDVATQYVRWKAIDSIVGGLGLIALSLVFLQASRKLTAMARHEDASVEAEVFGVLLAICCGIGAVVCLTVSGPYVSGAIKCYVAPKIVLMEGIKELVKP